MKTKSNPPFRLPSYITPKEYTLHITPDLTAQTFSGNVKIALDVSKKTDVIYLHAKDLVIGTATIQTKLNNKKVIFEPKITKVKNEDVVSFTISKKISGKVVIEISYTGIIHNDLRGFYISKYIHEGTEELIGATQFEAIDARRAFPCFDEPNMKAIFNLHMTVDKKYTVLSNTEVVNKINTVDNNTEYVFASSPKMSTYLLAWCIGKFERVSTASKTGTVVSVYTPLGKKANAKFALSVASKVLDYFEEYFGIDYPLNKMDLIALPDFASAAMENWGLITFRETCLLVDEKKSAEANKEWVALVIAHEIAHQWFGNLVTMNWWDDLWLNEGFANYIEYSCIDSIFPAWKIWEEFTAGDMGDALRLDSLKSSHPIEVKIEDAHDIDEIFDDITYRKGASVIRMLAEYVGHKNFQTGISKYLKANAYGNATTKDLWQHLEKVSCLPVQKIMGAYTRQAGFPIIKLTEDGNNLKCTQCRYYKNRALAKTEKDETLWPIPLDTGEDKLLLDAKKVNELVLFPEDCLLNATESNLLHIDYSPTFIKNQEIAILGGELNNIQRMGLIRNMRALLESGDAKVIEFLEYLNYFGAETNHIVLAEMWGGANRIMHVFGKDPNVNILLKRYFKNSFSEIIKNLNWTAIKKDDKKKSSIILAIAYKLEDLEIINQALDKFRKGPNTIPPHLSSTVYRIVVRYGSEIDKKNLWGLLETETLHEEKLRIISSFSAVEKARDIIDVLNYYCGDEIKSQDTPILIARMFAEVDKPEVVYNYITHNYGKFLDKYGKGGHLLSRLLGSMAMVRDAETLKHMRDFFKKYPAPGCKRTLDQVYEKINGSILFYKSDARDLESYLRKNLPR